jgi:putative ABC transport system permease protein
MKNSSNPPHMVLWLLLKFVPHEERVYFQQAVCEIFHSLSINKGRGVAQLWLLSQLLRSLPVLLSNSLYWSVQMFKNYLKITLRNLKKHKFYSVINITGLAIGIATCLTILLWMQGEWSYDRFHENADDLYRVVQESPQGGQIFHITVTPSALGPLLKEQYPEIFDSARYKTTLLDIGREDIHSREIAALVDESFLKMFSFPLLEGTTQASMEDPYSIVISEKMREKYFAGEDPLGKALCLGESVDLKVTGVLREIPKDSHLKFDCLLSFALLGESGYNMKDWGNNNYSTYVQLTEKASFQDMEAKISGVIQEHVPRSSSVLHLQPVVRIHLFALGGGGLITYLYIFAGMAVFILIIACINYMNLSTARSANRAKEVGIRQVVGANRTQLIRQFMGESILFSFIALIFGLLLVHLLLPASSRLAGKPVTVEYSTGLILTLLGLTLFTGILSGVYPALILSSLKSIQGLKGAISSRGGSALFRKILVVTQFSLSIFLIIGTLLVFRQMDFLMNKDLGYDKDNVVILPMRGQLFQNYDPLKTELLKNTNIISMTRANTTPDIKQSSIAGYDFSWDGRQEGDSFPNINVMGVDADYLETLNMEMVEGRFFSDQFPSDLSDSCVINEAAVAAMGLESPLGKRVYWEKSSAS